MRHAVIGVIGRMRASERAYLHARPLTIQRPCVMTKKTRITAELEKTKRKRDRTRRTCGEFFSFSRACLFAAVQQEHTMIDFFIDHITCP